MQSVCGYDIINPVITCLIREIFEINHPRDFWKFWNFTIFKNALWQFAQKHPPKYVITSTNYSIVTSQIKQKNFVKLGTSEVDLRKLSWNIKQPIYIIKFQIPRGFTIHLRKIRCSRKGIYYRIFKLISVISNKIYYISLEKNMIYMVFVSIKLT